MEETNYIPLDPNTTVASGIKIDTNIFSNKLNIFLIFLILLFLAIGFFLLYPTSSNSSVFAANTTYEGNWKTPGLRDLPIKLTILSISGDKAVVKYEWGTNSIGYSDGYIVQNTRIQQDGKMLTWGGNNGSLLFVFRLIKNGNLQGKRLSNNSHSTIIMTKISASPTKIPTATTKAPALETCVLNSKFKPFSAQQQIPFNDMLKAKSVSSEVANYVGAYQGKIEDETVRLIVFPSGSVLYVTALSNPILYYAYRTGKFFDRQLSWSTTVEGQLVFSYNIVKTDGSLNLHVIKYAEGMEFDSILTPCSLK